MQDSRPFLNQSLIGWRLSGQTPPRANDEKGRFSVTVIHCPSSTNKLPKDVKLVPADYSGDDDTAIVDTLRGQQALIITMAVLAPRDTVSKLARAAAKAGVP